jgi:hypothetical protein
MFLSILRWHKREKSNSIRSHEVPNHERTTLFFGFGKTMCPLSDNVKQQKKTYFYGNEKLSALSCILFTLVVNSIAWPEGHFSPSVSNTNPFASESSDVLSHDVSCCGTPCTSTHQYCGRTAWIGPFCTAHTSCPLHGTATLPAATWKHKRKGKVLTKRDSDNSTVHPTPTSSNLPLSCRLGGQNNK